MAYSKSQRKATEKWEAQNYEQIKFTVPKGFKARLTEASKLAGKSKRQFIIEALEKEMGEK
jgi:predicted DNA-binding protein